MSCSETILNYAFRSLGYGERLLPKADITLCEQVVLIGSGMIWNLYFAFLALVLGFFLATMIALGKASRNPFLSRIARLFIFIFRGSPLFLQFFFAYELFVLLPRLGFDLYLGFIEITVETRWLAKAWLGALLVLFINTSAYTAEIFYGAYQAVPKGEVEAAQAYGMNRFQIFRRIIWPTMMRLAWQSYTKQRSSFSLAFQPGDKAVTRFITRVILPRRRLIRLSPTRLLPLISFYSQSS